MGSPVIDNENSFRRDLEDEAPAIYAWAAARLATYGAAAEAPDFAHEVFLRALRAHRARNGAIENLRAWLFGIARKLLLEWIRARMERRAFGLGVGGESDELAEHIQVASSVTRRVAKNDQVAKLLALVREFDEVEQRVIVEFLIEGRASAELAKTVGLTDSGVRQMASRLRQALLARAPFAADYFID